MLKKLYYITSRDDCLDPCPYQKGKFIGSGICTEYCDRNYSDTYDETTHSGYVICDAPEEETK